MKQVFRAVAGTIRWSVSLGNKFMRVVPGLTLVSVISNVFSQFFMLAGFLLPLKVVLLLGSEQVPTYFPAIFHEFGRDGLVVILSIASIGFYLAHLLMLKVVGLTSASASKHLLFRSRKLAIFENQQEIASKGYSRYSQSLATVSFVSVCLFVLAWLYYEIALVISIYFIVSTLMLCLIASFSLSIRDRLNSELGSISRLLGSIGFLVSFAFIVIDHLIGNAPGIIISVISLLLARQSFSRLSNLAKDLQGLYTQKTQLAALFFHGHTFLQKAQSRSQGFWPLVEPSARNKWIRKLLSELINEEFELLDVQWFDIGLPDIVCYQIKINSDNGNKQIILKLFNVNRSAWAKHEATLISQQNSLPTLPLVKITVIDGLHCHIFDATGFESCEKSETAKLINDFLINLAAYKPHNDIVSLYSRSHPQIWKRLDNHSILRMRYLLDDKVDHQAVDNLLSALPKIMDHLRSLPLALVIPDIRAGMLWKSGEDFSALVNWTRWNIEPIGTKWTIASINHANFSNRILAIVNARSDINSVNINAIKLSVLVSEFENRLNRGRYVEAYSLIALIMLEFGQIELL